MRNYYSKTYTVARAQYTLARQGALVALQELTTGNKIKVGRESDVRAYAERMELSIITEEGSYESLSDTEKAEYNNALLSRGNSNWKGRAN